MTNISIFHGAVLACLLQSQGFSNDVVLDATPGVYEHDYGQDFPFTVFNGTALSGQSASLQFIFSNNDLFRLFTIGTGPLKATLNILLVLQTDAAGVPGFFGDQSGGYLVGANGLANTGPQAVGRAEGDNGQTGVDLVPSVSTPPIHPVFDFYGAHFDLVMPDTPGVTVTGGFIRIVGAGVGIGTPDSLPADVVPDRCSTASLLAMGLVGLTLARSRLRKPFANLKRG